MHPPGAARHGAHTIVASVNFEGLSSVDRETLVNGLALRPPVGRITIERTYFDALSHRLDVQRIEAYYRRHGFLSAEVTEAEVRALGGNKVALDYTIDEGPQTLVGQVTVALPEDSELSESALAQSTPLRSGAPLDYEQYERGKDVLLRTLLDQGRPFARVTGVIEVRAGKQAADLRYTIDPGPVSRFGPLTIAGNNRIPDSAIRARLTFSESERFSWKALEQSRASLYAMGVFASVDFEFDRDKIGETTAVTLRVREAARQQTKWGFGVGVDQVNYELRGILRHRISSFLTPLGTLQLEATPRVSYLRALDDDYVPGIEDFKPGIDASGSYTIQDIGETKLSLSSKLAYAIDNFTSYSIQGPRVSLGINRAFLGNRLQLGLAWRFRYQYLFRVDGALSAEDRIAVGLVEPYRLGTLVQRLSYDARDDIIAPTRGWFASLELEGASELLGSSFRYLRASPELRAYLPLTSATVVAARLRLASTLRIGDVLPITQRYFSGGSSSHRGFAQQTLSPVLGAQGGVPIGGEALVETSLELRHTLGDSSWAVVGFLDGAEVTEAPGELFAKPLHWATGLGLRWHTFVGVFRGDLGYRLNRNGPDEPAPGNNWEFFLNLGEAF